MRVPKGFSLERARRIQRVFAGRVLFRDLLLLLLILGLWRFLRLGVLGLRIGFPIFQPCCLFVRLHQFLRFLGC